jgi:3-phosphoshikimate 1-carboxyvinyltransferase
MNMTMEMMREHGAEVAWKGPRTIVVKGGTGYKPTPYYIESDWSAASYWYEIELLSDNRNETMELRGLFPGNLQGDSVVKDIFAQLSVQTFMLPQQEGEPHAILIRRGRMAKQLTWDFTKTPDLAQTLVVTCAMKGIAFHFSGLKSLRIKETDRIAALQKELRKLGVQVEVEGDDVMSWVGPQQQAPGEVPYLQPAEGTAIDTYEDHRMAMAFAPAAWVLGSICINNPEVVSKSYPRFWQDLQDAGFEVR